MKCEKKGETKSSVGSQGRHTKEKECEGRACESENGEEGRKQGRSR